MARNLFYPKNKINSDFSLVMQIMLIFIRIPHVHIVIPDFYDFPADLREEIVPAARGSFPLCAKCRSRTNEHGIWPGNETSSADAYKIRKWRPPQRTATTVL